MTPRAVPAPFHLQPGTEGRDLARPRGQAEMEAHQALVDTVAARIPAP